MDKQALELRQELRDAIGFEVWYCPFAIENGEIQPSFGFISKHGHFIGGGLTEKDLFKPSKRAAFIEHMVFANKKDEND